MNWQRSTFDGVTCGYLFGPFVINVVRDAENTVTQYSVHVTAKGKAPTYLGRFRTLADAKRRCAAHVVHSRAFGPRPVQMEGK